MARDVPNPITRKMFAQRKRELPYWPFRRHRRLTRVRMPPSFIVIVVVKSSSCADVDSSGDGGGIVIVLFCCVCMGNDGGWFIAVTTAFGRHLRWLSERVCLCFCQCVSVCLGCSAAAIATPRRLQNTLRHHDAVVCCTFCVLGAKENHRAHTRSHKTFEGAAGKGDRCRLMMCLHNCTA